MTKKVTAVLVSIILILAGLILTAPTAHAATYNSTGTIYLGAKIDHFVSTVPEPAASAAAIGSASITDYVAGRPWRVQTRVKGSSDYWKDVAANDPTSQWQYFRGWGGYEYRILADQWTSPSGNVYNQYIGPVTYYRLTTTFLDEFNDNVINTNKWAYRTGTVHDNAFTKVDPSACSENNDVLKVKLVDAPGFHQATANTEANPSHYNCMLTTKGSPENFSVSGNYWVAARVKFQPRDGAHTAAWTAGGYVPGGGEFDYAEYPADQSYNSLSGRKVWQNIYHTNSATDPYNAKKSYIDVTGDTQADMAGKMWWDSYHTYGMRYTGSSVQFYIDGDKMYTQVMDSPSVAPQELLLSMLSSDYAGTPEWATYNQTYLSGYAMLVDWVQVFE